MRCSHELECFQDSAGPQYGLAGNTETSRMYPSEVVQLQKGTIAFLFTAVTPERVFRCICIQDFSSPLSQPHPPAPPPWQFLALVLVKSQPISPQPNPISVPSFLWPLPLPCLIFRLSTMSSALNIIVHACPPGFRTHCFIHSYFRLETVLVPDFFFFF